MCVWIHYSFPLLKYDLWSLVTTPTCTPQRKHVTEDGVKFLPPTSLMSIKPCICLNKYFLRVPCICFGMHFAFSGNNLAPCPYVLRDFIQNSTRVSPLQEKDKKKKSIFCCSCLSQKGLQTICDASLSRYTAEDGKGSDIAGQRVWQQGKNGVVLSWSNTEKKKKGRESWL